MRKHAELPTVAEPAKPDPRVDREAREAQKSWDRWHAKDPEMAAVQLRNAKAARMLAITDESHPAYAEWEREYAAAGAALLDLMATRRSS